MSGFEHLAGQVLFPAHALHVWLHVRIPPHCPCPYPNLDRPVGSGSRGSHRMGDSEDSRASGPYPGGDRFRPAREGVVQWAYR